VNDAVGDIAAHAPASPEEEVTMLELLDRLLDKGVVLHGEVTLSVADVDLVFVGLRVLLTSVDTAQRWRMDLPPATAGGA
jgi:hypothetical protein